MFGNSNPCKPQSLCELLGLRAFGVPGGESSQDRHYDKKPVVADAIRTVSLNP